MNDQLSADFISELFYCCVQNKSILEICAEHIKENYLPTDEQKELFKEILLQHRTGFKKISWGTLTQEFRKNKEMLVYLNEIKHQEEPDSAALITKLENFIKQSRFIALYDECHDTYNKGNKDAAYTRLIAGADDLAKFNLKVDQLIRIIGDFQQRHAERVLVNSQNTNQKIPFGIDELDQVTNGGAEPGELVMWLGAAKSSKSIALIHNGVNALRRGIGVYHVQGEGTKVQILRRYDSAWSGITYYDVKDANLPSKTFDAYRKIVSNLGGIDIHVDCEEKYMQLNMEQIRRNLIELKKRQEIGAVVIDYCDLINPDGQNYSLADERHRQQKTVRAMKDLAVEQKVVVYTATQASSIPKELIDNPEFFVNSEHLAEDKGKVRPVDMLFSINRTADERKSKLARIYVDVLREHNSGQKIIIAQALARTRFYDRRRTLELELNDMDDE